MYHRYYLVVQVVSTQLQLHHVVPVLGGLLDVGVDLGLGRARRLPQDGRELLALRRHHRRHRRLELAQQLLLAKLISVARVHVIDCQPGGGPGIIFRTLFGWILGHYSTS